MYKPASTTRNKLLTWINEFLCTTYTKLEDASNGAVACQILDALFPRIVPMKQLDFAASTPYDVQKNYKVLQNVVSKLSLPIDVDVNSLSKRGVRESYDFLATLKAFFDDNYKGEPYDAVSRRKESKGVSKMPIKGSDLSSIISMSQQSPVFRKTMSTFRSDSYHVRSNHDPLDSPTPMAPQSSVAGQSVSAGLYQNMFSQDVNADDDSATNQVAIRTAESPRKWNHDEYHPTYDSQSNQRSEANIYTVMQRRIQSLEGEKNLLQEQCAQLSSDLVEFENLRKYREELLARERSFYYSKLRMIEEVLLEQESDHGLNATEYSIRDILYSKDGMEDFEFVSTDDKGEHDDVSVNSDDRASVGDSTVHDSNTCAEIAHGTS